MYKWYQKLKHKIYLRCITDLWRSILLKLNVCCIFLKKFGDTLTYNNIPFRVMSKFIFSIDQSTISLLFFLKAIVQLVNILNCLAYDWMVKDLKQDIVRTLSITKKKHLQKRYNKYLLSIILSRHEMQKGTSVFYHLDILEEYNFKPCMAYLYSKQICELIF